MKNKKLLLCNILLIVGLIFKFNIYRNENEESLKPKVEKKNLLSMNLEQTAGVGDYKTVSRSEWPTEGYIFNSELSRCENGSEISWDDTKKVVVVSGNLSDKCYVYFDIYQPTTLAEYVISQYTGTQGDNSLYYHNSTLTNGAGDNSYRYAVLTHGNTRIGVSSKIAKKDREAYKERLQEYQNDQYGLIIRTNAKDAAFEDVLTEIEQLKAEYEHLLKYAASRVCFSCLKSAPRSYITDLKNVYMDGMEEILVNDKEIYEKICSYFKKEMPENLELVHFHDDSGYPLGKIYSTETAVEHALSERVWLKHGGYLVIQVTEALTVIDVNSGKNVRKKGDDESTLKMNLEAAKETARQIRLRNLSGIILIDFINQDEEKNEEVLLKEFRYFLSKDPIQTTLVDITALGLAEVTRKKVRKPLHEAVREME